MLLAKTLSWYKKRIVGEKIKLYAENKEVSVRFGDRFGKRPNIIQHPNDVLDFAKRRATSFHCSEETWINPMMLRAGMSKKEMDELRSGWDLILDIDCTYWPVAKLATHLFIQAIKDHGVNAVTCKFSGSKGFHIAVPFEAFPKKIHNQETKDWFPQGPKRIAQYLIDYLSRTTLKVTDTDVVLGNFRISFKKLYEELGLVKDDLVIHVNERGEKKRINQGFEFLCSSCGNRISSKDDAEFMNCPRCKGIMKNFSQQKHEETVERILDATKLISLDTLLISARHAFRMPYSLHEKSMLVSCPVEIDKVLQFKKNDAKPENVRFDIPFLNRDVIEGEAAKLVTEAFDHNPDITREQEEKKEFEVPTEAIPEEHFPPCIKNILKGLEDGKKRSMFILQNFLMSCGWSHEMIEERIKKWNEDNPERLRETIIVGSLRYAKQRKEILPPPNCRGYYQELQVCQPDNLCDKIKNPVQYAKHKRKHSRTPKKRTVKKSQPSKTNDEQKHHE